MPQFMLNEHIEKHELTIVVIGSFNPAIISPYWLSSKNFIRESEAASAKVNLIHPEITNFDLEWVDFEVSQQRFSIHSSKEPFFDAVIDLAFNIFNILRETPITSYGYNHHKYITLIDEEKYYEFGNRLCPLSNWSAFSNPRLQRIEILDRESSLKSEGSLTASVNAISESAIPFGIAITVNDHYNYKPDSKDNKFLPKYLIENWSFSNSITTETLDNLSKAINL